jgi:thioredoxin 1
MSTAPFVQDSEFQALVASEIPVVIDCTAAWCDPCRKVAPIIDKLSEDFEGQAKVVKLDVDKNPTTAKELGVRSIPAVFFFHGGVMVDSIIGVASYHQFKEILERFL